MKTKKITLPRVYDNPHGNYPQFVGRPKLSYSQYTSFISSDYLGDYIASYFLGIDTEGNSFSSYGSAAGTYLEFKGQDKLKELKQLIKDGKEPDYFSWLSDNDVEILNKQPLPKNSQYEYEIVIDLLPITGVDLVLQGYVDRATFYDKEVDVIDYKTGNIAKKEEFYAGEEYYQTRIYSYALEQLGFKIKYCGVELLSRKGNGMEKYPLKLEDKTLSISTPYNKEQVETKLKEIAKVAVEISDMYKTYNKIFT